jgi:hypothetical protein
MVDYNRTILGLKVCFMCKRLYEATPGPLCHTCKGYMESEKE